MASAQRHRKQITYEEIAKCFEKPLDEAAAALQISTSSLKRLCREYQIPKWPYRKICSIQKKIAKTNKVPSNSDFKSMLQVYCKIYQYQQLIEDIKVEPKILQELPKAPSRGQGTKSSKKSNKTLFIDCSLEFKQKKELKQKKMREALNKKLRVQFLCN